MQKLNRIKTKKTSGFTIIELLIVIAIVAILAGIVFVSYKGIANRAKDAAEIAELNNVQKRLAMDFIANDKYPDTNDCGQEESVSNICIKSFEYESNNSGQGYTLRSIRSNDDVRPPFIATEKEGPKSFSGWAQISGGYAHSCGIYYDRNVYCWGNNQYGQLGNGTTEDSVRPVQVKDKNGNSDLFDIKSLVVGYSHTLALANDGTVWAWGNNNLGQLGDNTTSPKSLPVQVRNSNSSAPLSGIAALSIGSSHHSLALTNDGTVWAWGWNIDGQLGDNTTSPKVLPVQVRNSDDSAPLVDIKTLVVGLNHSLALTKDGTVWAWGKNSSGQLGDNTTSPKVLPVQVRNSDDTSPLVGIKDLAAGSAHSLALTVDGTVWAWGWNLNGQLGDNTNGRKSLPIQVRNSDNSAPLADIGSLAASYEHSLALTRGGMVWAWGLNSSGQLGDGTINSKFLPTQVRNSDNSAPMAGIKALEAGLYHSLALTKDGVVWAWGRNNMGQLGDGAKINYRKLPVKLVIPGTIF